MHFLDHSMRKRLRLGVRDGLLIVLLIEAILLSVRLLVVLAIFGSLTSLKIILFVATLACFCYWFISRNDNYLNLRDQTEVFCHLVTITYFCHHIEINAFSNDLVVRYAFAHYFYNIYFFAFFKIFFTTYIARPVMKPAERGPPLL